MPSHLRNGKDLSFEQLRTKRREQQQQVAETVARQSSIKPPSTSDHLGINEYPASVSDPTGAVYPPGSDGQRSTAVQLGPSGDQPPVGYTFSPAALERLQRTRELHAHASRGDRSARDGADLPTGPGHSPFGSLLEGAVHSRDVVVIHF